MATVITTQPTYSSIIDPEEKSQQNNSISNNVENELIKSSEIVKEDTKLLTAGVVSDEMVHLNSVENEEEEKRMLQEEEKRKLQEEQKLRAQEQTGDYNQDCCCIYNTSDVDDPCFLYYCISSCFRSLHTCTDNCFNGCGNCISNCCDSDNAVVDGQNGHSDCDCGGCDCGECDCGECDCGECDCGGCDCSGCDCSGCDCGDCNCADCAECCLCLGSLLECCKN